MADLVDVRVDTLSPGELVCFGGAVILITAVSRHGEVIDLHTEYGPALRFVASDIVAVALAGEDGRPVGDVADAA